MNKTAEMLMADNQALRARVAELEGALEEAAGDAMNLSMACPPTTSDREWADKMGTVENAVRYYTGIGRAETERTKAR